jgi:hypothetical protein
MHAKTFIRLFIVIILLSAGIFMISRQQATASADSKECTGGVPCDQNRVQSDFLLWESFARNFFGNNS